MWKEFLDIYKAWKIINHFYKLFTIMNIGEVFKNQLLAPTKGMNLIIDRFS